MSFVWIDQIPLSRIEDVGALIDADADTVDDEKCVADEDAANCPGYCNNENSGYLSSDQCL